VGDRREREGGRDDVAPCRMRSMGAVAARRRGATRRERRTRDISRSSRKKKQKLGIFSGLDSNENPKKVKRS